MQLEQSFTTTAAPVVRIDSVGGNLTVHGTDEGRVWVRSDGDTLRAQQDGDTISVTSDSDCRLQVPQGARLTVENVSGDAHVLDVRGALTVGSVSGNLRLTSVAAAQIGNVSGDLSVRQAAEGVTVRNVSGNTILVGVDGPAAVNSSGGDIVVKEVMGDLTLRAGGDIRMRLALPSSSISANAGGDIRCRVPVDFQAQVKLTCGGDIRVKRLDTPIARARQNAEFTLGEGAGTLTLRAGGDILISGPRPDEDDESSVFIDVELQEEMAERAGELVQQVVDQVETQVEALARQLDERLAALGSGDEIAAKVQLKIQNALRKAEDKIAAATRRAEDQSRAAERRAERRAAVQHIPIVPPVPPAPPRPAPPKAPSGPTDQERMQILRMLEEGKISVEQAEQLLAAMGG